MNMDYLKSFSKALPPIIQGFEPPQQNPSSERPILGSLSSISETGFSRPILRFMARGIYGTEFPTSLYPCLLRRPSCSFQILSFLPRRYKSAFLGKAEVMDSRSQVIIDHMSKVWASLCPYLLCGLWLNDALELQTSPLRRPWNESQATKRGYSARQWRHTRVANDIYPNKH